MELREDRSYESGFKLEFKNAFIKLMGSVDLATGDVGKDELGRMKDCVTELHQSVAKRSKSRESASWWPGREVLFSSGVGQLKLPEEEGVDVFVENCSSGYLNHVSDLSSETGLRRGSLTDHSFIKREIEGAARNSGTYKTLKMRLQGIAYGGEPGRYGKIKKLDVGISARADGVFFLGLINSVNYQKNKMSVYVISGMPAKNPLEYVDPDHVGFDSVRRAHVVRTALNYEMVIGEKYNPKLLKKRL